MKKRIPRWTAILTAFAIAAHPAISLGAPTEFEYKVKAAFLYNFAKFVEWPTSAFDSEEAPFVFCIVGEDPFGGNLEATVKGRTASGRRIVVRRGPSVEALGRCHLVFIGATEDDQVARELHEVSGQPVLTVGESTAFAKAGGMIRLFVEEKRIRFDINERAAREAGLRISSQLLKLARRVTR